MSWEVLPGEAILDGAAEWWSQANHELAGDHPLLDLKFLQPLFRHFGDPAMRLALHRGDGGVDAAALLQRHGLTGWELFLPAQAAMGALILRRGLSGDAQAALFDALLRALPGHRATLGLLKLDPCLVPGEALRSHPRAVITAYGDTTNVDVSGDFEAFWGGRRKNVRQHVNRARRRLEQGGIEYRLRVCDARDEIAAALADYGRIESSTWKGREGTAVHADNVQGRFYTETLERFAEHGGAGVYQLLFDGQSVASLLTVAQAGMRVVLKTTYDEDFSRFGPGRLLDFLMLQHVFADPAVQVVENYTNASREDRKWCTGERTMYHLGFYRSRLGRALAQLRGRWLSKAPEAPPEEEQA